MEREILLTGIGGQGVQLAAQVLARAATLEARSVTMLGLYGGMMRGGNTDSTIIVADRPIAAPPIVPRAWAVIAMHDEFFAPLASKLRAGSVVFANDSTFGDEVPAAVTLHRLAATETAVALGNPLGGSMVMLGAFAAATLVVEIESVIEAMRRSIPPYRTQHIAANETAIRAGAGLVEPGSHPAWVGDREGASA
jgi:Pyruvate/2-oxoacid:ferredoxin oxidoreductase gamma subunit